MRLPTLDPTLLATLLLLAPTTTAWSFQAFFGPSCEPHLGGMTLTHINTNDTSFLTWQQENSKCYRTRDRTGMKVAWTPSENLGKVEMLMCNEYDCRDCLKAGFEIENDVCFFPDKTGNGNRWYSAFIRPWPKDGDATNYI